ncbi:MAG: coproporphyrinogen dehydrogenase HemZ [Firmicutes bacterium]|nr:coproporphyrinogen dehydrogenase HemZ [Bacillota bacterium]
MQRKPWGTMVGVRPSKQLHKLLDAGLAYEEAYASMHAQYQISEEKFALLWHVCQKERLIMQESSRPDLFSVYVGIPFCPTRCLYCSFPSHSLAELGKLRSPFVESLLAEIAETGKLAAGLGLKPYTVYLGGGTPTSLAPAELAAVLFALREAFPGRWRELTVEAGRPDTITEEHLECMRRFGVDRISINPQSMHDKTLAIIGRKHSSEDIRQAVAMVRRAGIPVLNMDLILGLPEENTDMVAESVSQTMALEPENITVHTFSRKRASRYNLESTAYNLPGTDEIIAMQKTAYELLATRYEPYYLYRQRDILGGLENTGFAIPGHECIYNVVMIEERHHILGLGGGATSKIINPDLTLQNIATPKDVRMYLERLPQLLTKRSAALRAALTRQHKGIPEP